jgi:hypothetical protein
VRSISLLLLLLLLIACGSVVDSNPSHGSAGAGSDSFAGSASTRARARVPLCDGSTDIRITYELGGGAVEETYGFTNPDGFAFFLIDGSCRYYAGQNYMRGIVSGTLTPGEAQEFSTDLHWSELDGWTWGAKELGCPDASGATLSKAGVAATCTCGCDAGAPKGLDAALSKAYAWVERLTREGQPLDGPVSAVALSSSAADMPVVLAWPLTRTLRSISNLIVERGDARLWMGTGPWARFTDTAEIMKLREMRTMVTNMDVSGSGSVHTFVIVRESADAELYNLYVRDELPDATVKAWDALKATLPKP